MATIIRVDFATRTVADVAADEPTDFSTYSLEELLREAEEELLSGRARGPEPPDAETRCPVCHSASCSLWLDSLGPRLTLVR